MPAPTPLFDRRAWWLKPEAPLTCAEAHVIPWHTDLPEDGFVHCETCHQVLYVSRWTRRGNVRFLLVEVSGAEKREALERSLSTDETLELLGLMLALSWRAGRDKRTARPPSR